jgi:Skp family chaperone for outer membrane proteins
MKSHQTLINGLSALVLLATVAFAMVGFQGANEKTGIVDMNRLIVDSEFGKTNNQKLQTMAAAREDLLKFIDRYKVLTMDQATRLRDLSLKDAPTDRDKVDADAIKKQVIEADKKRNELLAKAEATADERNQLTDFNNRAALMREMLPQWGDQFNGELSDAQSKLREAAITRAKDALKEVGKAGQYTVILENQVAPYGANDVTDAAIKAMNAKK